MTGWRGKPTWSGCPWPVFDYRPRNTWPLRNVKGMDGGTQTRTDSPGEKIAWALGNIHSEGCVGIQTRSWRLAFTRSERKQEGGNQSWGADIGSSLGGNDIYQAVAGIGVTEKERVTLNRTVGVERWGCHSEGDMKTPMRHLEITRRPCDTPGSGQKWHVGKTVSVRSSSSLTPLTAAEYHALWETGRKSRRCRYEAAESGAGRSGRWAEGLHLAFKFPSVWPQARAGCRLVKG